MRANPIVTKIDLDGEGVRHGYLRLPHSRDDSAWGAVMIPITVAKNGEGPTALLTGGNHGDEYEGPIALFKLAQNIDANAIRGRIIIVPAMNYPAFRAGRRTSPIDGGNLNRLFPGRPDGTVTEKIADYFQRVLLPMSDYVLDIHSGGRTLEFLPFAACHVLDDKAHEARCEAAMLAFDAPYAVKMREIDAVGMFDSASEAMGKVFVTTELGGGGTASAKTVTIAVSGVTNFLKHAGVLPGSVSRSPTVRLTMPADDCYVVGEHTGLLEPCVDLGTAVRAGDFVAHIFDIERTGAAPWVYRAARDGVLVGRHFPGLVHAGDCLAVVAVPDA